MTKRVLMLSLLIFVASCATPPVTVCPVLTPPPDALMSPPQEPMSLSLTPPQQERMPRK